MARFCPLFSGSSGNSLLLEASGARILIDAGKNAKQLELALNAVSVEPSEIQAVFVTHEHTDHISALRVFCSRYHTPVYASRGTLRELVSMGICNGQFPVHEIDESGKTLSDLKITPFATSHDAAESFGYTIETADDRKLSIATDLGVMTETVRQALRGSDLILIESNHDVHMLQSGGYPYPLKRRILSETGHLSNECCADELCGFMELGTTRFILAHLSRENNMPRLAYQTALNALTEKGGREGLDFLMQVATQVNATKAMVL